MCPIVIGIAGLLLGTAPAHDAEYGRIDRTLVREPVKNRCLLDTFL
jgi:hypothetical protein